jgi:hypothetical protein
VTDEELAGQPGAVATRAEDEADSAAAEPVFSPKDFRLNLGARLAVADEPLTSVAAHLGVVADEPLPNLDSPAIRKLTWEHVVPDRPESSAPSAATLAPLPPPRRVPPPPPQPVNKFEPPAAAVPPEADVEVFASEPVVVDDALDLVEVDQIDHEVVREETVDEVEAVEDEEVVIDDGAVIDEDEDEVDAVPVEADAVEADVVDDDIEAHELAAVVQTAAPAGQPEVNRLGSVPDLFDDDDDAPIELPPITPSGPIVASPVAPTPVYAPVLAETLYVPPPTRNPTSMIAAVAVDQGKKGKGKKGKPHSGRKQKRHLFRTFMTLVILFGLLAGGAFAAKKYLLHEPTWSAELKPLADEVAATRGLQFSEAVDVSPVPVADYAARLAGSAIDTSGQTLPTWRALGLVNGQLDLEAIGRQAMNDSPAFYDAATKTIYVSEDLQAQAHLYKFAIHRAMTMALLDQQYDWSGRAASATPAASFALRATVDADALAVANTLAAGDTPELLAAEQLAFAQGHGDVASTSPYAAHLAGRIGVALRPTIAAADAASLTALEQATPLNDDIFDARRPPAIVASPPGTQGMMFWYYVLASRIDDGQAWTAATRWLGDSLVTSTDATSQCVDAKIAAADPDGAASLLASFTAWAAAAPAESATVVVPIEGNQVSIRACDPGATLTAQLPAKVPVAFGGAGVEGALVAAARSAAGEAIVDANCLVTAARQRGVALASPADDAPVVAVGWEPAFVAANLDLGAGCVSAAPVAPAPTPTVAPAAPETPAP